MTMPFAARLLYHYATPRWLCNLRTFLAINVTVLVTNIFLQAFNSGWIGLSDWPIESYFGSPITAVESDSLREIFKVFHDAMTSHNVTYFLFSGSLLGSYRHHDRIHWDDDVDVIINCTDKSKVRGIFRSLSPTYDFYEPPGRDSRYQWKLYRSDGRSILYPLYRRHKFPNVDVFFFRENRTHIWNESPDFESSECWIKSIVFPLSKRPFGALMVPAPCDTRAFLDANFDVAICEARSYSHYFDVHMLSTPKRVACDQLRHIFPFVRRRAAVKKELGKDDVGGLLLEMGGGDVTKYEVESLELRSWILQEFTLRSRC